MNSLAPTKFEERIGSLDFLRGIAILGILVINVESFSYPDPWSPYKFGFHSDADHTTRFWVYFLAQGKFFGMFTLLFGVGFYMFLERLEHKGLGLEALNIYARRLLWLFVFGVIHAYLIWDGDVLYHYAICGFLLFPFRSLAVKQLLLVLLIPISVLLFNSYESVTRTANQFQGYTQIARAGEHDRTSEDLTQMERWEKRTTRQASDTSMIANPRNTIIESWQVNADHTRVHKGVILYTGIFFRTMIMMLLGIILYKIGVFTNYQAMKHYWLITLGLFTIALVVNYLRYDHWTFSYFEPVTSLWKGWLFMFPKELMGLSYILLFNGLYQLTLKKWKWKLLSNAGRMALTNYIFQSILCSLIFYGFALGKYNYYSRTELLLIVVAIWIVQLVFSWVWMKRFTYGPLEWVWRKLTYR